MARREKGRAGRVSARATRQFAGRLLSRGLVAVGVALIIAGPLVRSSASTLSDPSIGSRPIEEAVRYSARPWMLVTPPHDNPIFGRWTREFVQANLFEAPVYEQSIYLGWTVIVLAALGLWRPWRRFDGSDFVRFVRPFAAAGAVTGLVIMLGPHVPLDDDYWRLWATPNETRHLPSLGSLMFEITSVFRFSSRAFVVLSVCVALLAAIGLLRLRRRISSPVVSGIVLVTAFALIAVEFANAPPHVFTRDGNPPWVQAVEDLPSDAAIAQYPLADENSPRSLYYLYWQRRHDRATVNPSRTAEAKFFVAQIADPDSESGGRALAGNGIDFVVVHTSLPALTTPPYQPALPNDAMPRDAGVLNPWLDRVRQLPDSVIYRVRPAPRAVTDAAARFGDGWGPSELRGERSVRWLLAPRGTLILRSVGPASPRKLSLRVASFAVARKVTIALDGKSIGTITARADRTLVATVSLGRLGPGTYALTLEPQPGGEVIGDRLGNSDGRRVSIELDDQIDVTG